MVQREVLKSIPCHSSSCWEQFTHLYHPSLCLISMGIKATPQSIYWCSYFRVMVNIIALTLHVYSSLGFCLEVKTGAGEVTPGGLSVPAWILELTLEIKSFRISVVHLLLEKLHDSDIPKLLKEAWDKRSPWSRNCLTNDSWMWLSPWWQLHNPP